MDSRYEKQTLCSFIGETGQQKIAKKHVCIIGAGALGSASSEMLVRAGVGKLTIVDRDYVEWSNLQRQQLYTEADANNSMPKAIAAQKRLQKINSEVQIEAHVIDATPPLLEPILKDVDVLLDATDNFEIRFILNDLSQKYDIPFIFAACVGSFGSTYTIIPGKTPCLQCLLKKVPVTGATCDSEGIINTTIQLIASYQVTECLKLLVEDEDSLRDTYFSVDVWRNQHYSLQVEKAKDENCSSCGKNATYPYLQFHSQTNAQVLCGRNTVQLRTRVQKFDWGFLEKKLKKKGTVKSNPFLLSCDIDSFRFVFFKDGRILVHGTNDILKAKKLFYRLIG